MKLETTCAMIEARAPLKPFDHQLIGSHALVQRSNPAVGRELPNCFALFDEMGAGKTKQVCDAVQVLFELGLLQNVIVIGPNPIKSVWFDQEIGEILKHRWPDMPVNVTEFHGRVRNWHRGRQGLRINWIVTNLEFIRGSKDKIDEIIHRWAGKSTLLVVDESWAVKCWTAKQTKAVIKLRKRCGRVVLLNGTPQSNNLEDLFSQAYIMNPDILGYKNQKVFRSQHAIMGGWQNKQIVGWRDVEVIQNKLKPYVLRRLKNDCLDLPEKMPPVTLTAALTPSTWKIYKQMRDDAVAWLSSNVSASPQQAGVKVMRLAQITSGFLGGLLEQSLCSSCEGAGQVEDDLCLTCGGAGYETRSLEPETVGTEKLEVFEEWAKTLLEGKPTVKAIVWCRFRRELFAVQAIAQKLGFEVGLLCGGQKKVDREHTLRLLHPQTSPKDRPVMGIGIPASGAVGLNFAAADHTLWMSHESSLKNRLQADDRVHRSGQVNKVWYGDVIATGPEGQKTIDHHVIKALRNKEDAATFTCSKWISVLTEDAHDN